MDEADRDKTPPRDSIMESLRAIAISRKGFPPPSIEAFRTTTRGMFKFVCDKCQTVVVVNCPNCADLRARLAEVEALDPRLHGDRGPATAFFASGASMEPLMRMLDRWREEDGAAAPEE